MNRRFSQMTQIRTRTDLWNRCESLVDQMDIKIEAGA